MGISGGRMPVTRLDNTTFDAPLRGGETVRIGGDTAEFKPAVRLGRRLFGDVEVSYPQLDKLRMTPTLTGDRVEAGNNTWGLRFYPLDIDEEGGFEFEVVLKRKVAQSSFVFNVKGHEQYDFFYQPELTAEEIAEGTFRPDNVVGSYAVYHKTKRNHVLGKENYKTGKAFHIYRPEFIAADGARAWGGLSFDPATGNLTVTGDPAWLSKAVYPVVIDPTFGHTSVGATMDFAPANYLVGQKGTPADSGTVDSVTAYIRSLSGTGNYKAVLVLHSTRNIVTDGIGGTVGYDVTPAWQTASYAIPPSVIGGTEYIASAVFEVNTYFFYDSTGSPQGFKDTSNSYSSPTNPSDSNGFANKYYSFYCTYTAEASVVAPTITTSACTDVATTTATGNGNITDTGGENCTRRGFCYMEGTSGDPDTTDSVAYDDGSYGTGAYTKGLTGLSAGTNYRVRSYAVNSAGTGYGTTVQLLTANPQTVTPTTLALTTSTYAPVIAVSNHQLATPITLALSTTTYEPTVTATNPQTTTPTLGELALTTYAPTVLATAHQVATPSTLALSATTYAPVISISDHQVVTPDISELTLVPYAPDVATTAHQSVIPTTLELALTTYEPTITTSDHQSVTPITAELTLTTLVPSVTASNTVTPSLLELALTTYAPTVTASAHQTITPGIAELALTSYEPTVSVSNHQLVTPSTLALVLSTFVPTVGNPVVVTPSTAELVLATFAPTVSATAHVTVTPSTAELVITSYAPTVTAQDAQLATPTAAELVLTTFAPTVSLSSNQTVTPQMAILTLALFAPSIILPVVCTPETLALTLTTYAPGINALVVIPLTASLILTTYAPQSWRTINAVLKVWNGSAWDVAKLKVYGWG